MRFLKVSEHILHLCMIPPPCVSVRTFPRRTIPEQLSEIFPLSVPVSLNLPQRRPAMNAPERMAFRVRVRMWACAVKVNSEAADLFMSCGAFVNFSAGVAWSDPHYTSLCLCARASVCVCVCVCLCLCVRPITVSQRNVFSCRLSSFTAPVSLSSPLHHSISSSLSPPVFFFFFFSLLESLLAQEPSFIHAPGPSMPFSAGCQELLFKN